MAHSRFGSRMVCRLVIVSLAASLIAGFIPATSQAQTPVAGQPPHDLAALLIQPQDLEQRSMPGYGVDQSRLFTTVEEVVSADPYAYSRGPIALDSDPDAADTLRGAEWLRYHELLLATSAEPDSTEYATVIASGIEEYATADGAATALDRFSDAGMLDAIMGGTATPVADAPAIGDRAVMWTVKGAMRERGQDGSGITLWIQTGPFIVSASMIDFTGEDRLDPEALQGLVAQQVERVGSASAGGSCLPGEMAQAAGGAVYLPGLSTCLTRLSSETVTTLEARYEVLEGTVVPIHGDTAEETVVRQEDVSTIGVVNRYWIFQQVDDVPISFGGGNMHVSAQIETYIDADAASTRFAGTEQRIRAAQGVTIETFDAGIPAIGDDSATYAFADNVDRSYTTTSVFRVDTMLVSIRTTRTYQPIPDVTSALLADQLACMNEGNCLTPLPVPDALVAALPQQWMRVGNPDVS